MRRKQTHHHPCDWKHLGCQNVVACDDENLERNFDGMPDPACRVVDIGGEAIECEACHTGRCDECRCIVRLEGHESDCARVLSGEICRWCLKADTVDCALGRYASCADCAGDDPRAGASA